MHLHISLIPGDGVGPEVVAAACDVLDVGRVQVRAHGRAAVLPDGRRRVARRAVRRFRLRRWQGCLASKATLMGAVGDPAFDHLPSKERPEGGLLALRKGLGVFANLRPTRIWPGPGRRGAACGRRSRAEPTC